MYVLEFNHCPVRMRPVELHTATDASHLGWGATQGQDAAPEAVSPDRHHLRPPYNRPIHQCNQQSSSPPQFSVLWTPAKGFDTIA